MRNQKQKGTPIDLTVPIKPSEVKTDYPEDDCFGKEWAPRAKECSNCADFEVCGIVYDDSVRKKQQAEFEGELFLDQANFDFDTDKLLSKIKDGKTTSAELVDMVIELSKCDDEVAVRNWIVDFIKEKKIIKIASGIVWFRK